MYYYVFYTLDLLNRGNMFGTRRRAQRAAIHAALFTLIESAPNGLTVRVKYDTLAGCLSRKLHRVMTMDDETVSPQLKKLGLDGSHEDHLSALLVELAAVASYRRVFVLQRVIRDALRSGDLTFAVKELGAHPRHNVMTSKQATDLGYCRVM